MNGRVALVTGASRGIGRAVATRFEELGARVLAPPRAELDLGDSASVDRFLARLDQPIDILVNDAGVNRLAALVETDDDLLRETSVAASRSSASPRSSSGTKNQPAMAPKSASTSIFSCTSGATSRVSAACPISSVRPASTVSRAQWLSSSGHRGSW